MGLKGKTAIFETIFEWAAGAVWPRVSDAAIKALMGNPPQDWGPTSQVDMAYEDGSAILRSLNFSAHASAPLIAAGWPRQAPPAAAAAAATEEEDGDSDNEFAGSPAAVGGAADDEEEAPDDDVADFRITRPSHVVDYLIRRYMKLLERCEKLKDIRFVLDYVGYTPRIKEIIREYRSANAIIWPRDPARRESLFESNEPFLNSANDVFADPEARRLYFKYITEHLLERLVREPGFPKGCSITIYGAVYKDTPGQCVAMASLCSTTGLPLPVCVMPGNENGLPMGEADIVIRWLLNLHRSTHNQLLIAPDSDFLPILMHVINDKFREDPQPHKYNIYWQLRISYSATVNKVDYMRQLLPVGATLNPHDRAVYYKLCQSWEQLCSKHIKPKKRVSKKAAAAGPPDSFNVRVSKRHHVLDMNAIFGNVWARVFKAAPNCKLCDPIDTFNVLCHMAGGDYLKPCSFITFKILWQAYSSTPDLHARLGECLCCRRDGIDGRLSFSVPAMERFIVIAYRHLHKVTLAELPSDDLKGLINLLQQRVANKQLTLKSRATKFDNSVLAAHPTSSEERMGFVASEALQKRKEPDTLEGYVKVKPAPSRIPPEDLMGFIARLYWVINYYTRYHNGSYNIWTMDPVAETESGLSLYGYSYNPNIRRHEFASRTLQRRYLF